MSSKVDCPSCKMRLNIAPEMFGQPLTCPGCKHSFVPEPLENAPVPAPSNPSPEPLRASFPPTTMRPDGQPPMNIGPQPRDSNPLPLILGCLGGGCLLIVIIVALIVLISQRF